MSVDIVYSISMHQMYTVSDVSEKAQYTTLVA